MSRPPIGGVQLLRRRCTRGKQLEADWSSTFGNYEEKFPELADEFKFSIAGKMPAGWTTCILKEVDIPQEPIATRKSAGLVGNPLGEHMGNFLVITVDLTPPCNSAYQEEVDFQSVSADSSSHGFRMNYRPLSA
jgi:dihydroxyacetone synthase